MRFALQHSGAPLVFILLLPALCLCQDGYVCTRATYYGSPDCLGSPIGACGYGEYGRTVNNGEVSGVSRLFKNGTGCGACYQVRCRTPELCNPEGTKIVVTDFGEGHYTDFILSERAYARLAASETLAAELFAAGVIEVEYKRIPCQYPGSNLLVKIQDHSKFPHYIAIIILYQAGSYDITAVEVWEEYCKQWRPMRKPYGAVWDMENPPRGALTFRFQASGGTEVKWVQPNVLIPADWKAGLAIDTAIQFV